MAVRYAEKFVSADGLLTYTFPLKAYEWESSGGLRLAPAPAIGADFAYDGLRSQIAPQEVASENVRFIVVSTTSALVDTAVDEARATLLRIGRGRLYTLTAAGVRRWCWARIRQMPQTRVAVGNNLHEGMALAFDRYSPWYSEAQTNFSTTFTSSGQTAVITPSGNLPVTLMAIRIRSNSAAGFTDPNLKNQTNGYEFTSSRDASSSNDELKIDTEAMTVKRSTDDGVNYTDDFANLTLPAGQVGFFRLEPGANTLQYVGGGTPNLNVDIAFYEVFA